MYSCLETLKQKVHLYAVAGIVYSYNAVAVVSKFDNFLTNLSSAMHIKNKQQQYKNQAEEKRIGKIETESTQYAVAGIVYTFVFKSIMQL